MRELTEKQKNILQFIEEFSEKEGMAPTVYEIGEKFNIKTSTVFAHLKALQRKNQLTRSSKARSIALRNGRKPVPHMSFLTAIPLTPVCRLMHRSIANGIFMLNRLCWHGSRTISSLLCGFPVKVCVILAFWMAIL